jgi:dTDP-4-dehydrorhamnose reductase
VRVAITGAGGRLGRALVAALASSGLADDGGLLAWDLPDHDLDDPASAGRIVRRDRPGIVIHTAAWTDVDGCARDPELAMRRNGIATGELADACVTTGADLVVISTNEVFDGRRTDGRGYLPGDRPSPGNPYATGKLAGETAAQAAFLRAGGRIAAGGESDADGGAARRPRLAIVRTAWLYGPPGNDFPSKIIAAAERARAAGETFSVVGDEIGTPTYTPDLAAGTLALLADGRFAGIYHLVNGGHVSRAGWARVVLAAVGLDVAIREVPLSTWVRPSTPPAWGVLEPSVLPGGGTLRPWEAAFADDVPRLVRARTAERR